MKIVLCALKCDLREEHEKDDVDAEPQDQTSSLIQYAEGLEAAKRIGALRYLGELCTETRAAMCGWC